MDTAPSAQENDDLLTLDQAAKEIGLSRATIWRRYKAGRLRPAIEPNPASDRVHRLLFHRADVLALAAPHLDAAPRGELAEEPPGYDPHG